MAPASHEQCRPRTDAVAQRCLEEKLHLPSAAGQLAPFLVVALMLACSIGAAAAPWPIAALLLVLGGYCHVVIAFIGHDAGHGCHSRSAAGNAIVGTWMFAHSFTNYFGFRVMHRGHHRYTAFDEDPSGDSPKHAKRVGLITYSTLVLLPFGFPILVILPSWLGGLGFQPRVYKASERWKIWAIAPIVAAYQWGLWRLLGPDGYAAYLATFVIGLWLTTMVLSLSHASVQMYTDCKLCNTRTVATGHLLGLLTAYGGYHVEHHIAPTVPWYRMMRVHEILREEGGSTYCSNSFTELHLGAVRGYVKRAVETAARVLRPGVGAA